MEFLHSCVTPFSAVAFSPGDLLVLLSLMVLLVIIARPTLTKWMKIDAGATPSYYRLTEYGHISWATSPGVVVAMGSRHRSWRWL